uniref:DacP n=1 Tax=Dactylosporangium sp. SC14051 TaxID=1239282 RepID=K4I6Q3_9ACTN|nr:DacP [Dactylosporangium sp. SC14051]
MSGRPVALLLPGQGSQHPGMAVELYGAEPAFTAAMDGFLGLLGAEGRRLRAAWLSGAPGGAFDDAATAQPLLFAVGYALGRTLHERGVRPVALLGHSVGELAAAVLAGVLDLPGAAHVNLARTAAMVGAPPGGMLAVVAAAADLAPYVDPPGDPDGVVVGAVNAPRQTVLCGPLPRLTAVAGRLATDGVVHRAVAARQPFHSPALAGAAARFAAAFAGVPLAAPRIPVWSTRTGAVVAAAQAVDGGFWGGQLAAPVLFWPALDALLAGGGYTLVEAGPGQLLTTLARRHPAVRAGRSAVVPLLPSGPTGARETFDAALATLTGPGPWP